MEVQYRSDGKTGTFNSDFAVCTIPFSVLKNKKLAGFSREKMEGIATLNYAGGSKVLLHCRERFWETKYGIFNGASVSDRLVRQVYYPSNNQKSQTSGVLLGSYTIGNDTRLLNGKSPEERLFIIKNNIGRFHPEMMQDNMIAGSMGVNWEEYRWTQGACSVLWDEENTDTTSSAKLTNLDHAIRRPEGHLFFAGEHCSDLKGWMEGAVISALDAVQDIYKKASEKVLWMNEVA